MLGKLLHGLVQSATTYRPARRATCTIGMMKPTRLDYFPECIVVVLFCTSTSVSKGESTGVSTINSLGDHGSQKSIPLSCKGIMAPVRGYVPPTPTFQTHVKGLLQRRHGRRRAMYAMTHTKQLPRARVLVARDDRAGASNHMCVQ
jgi:hypothetical protein